MQVEFTISSGKYLVTIHGRHPEAKVESIIEYFTDAGIKVHKRSVIKAWIPGEPTSTFRITLEGYQYDAMIRQAFMAETARTPAAIDAGTF